jgi:hypothetical protein
MAYMYQMLMQTVQVVALKWFAIMMSHDDKALHYLRYDFSPWSVRGGPRTWEWILQKKKIKLVPVSRDQ